MAYGQWSDTIRKARKNYRCSSCDGSIEPNQMYVHWKTVGEDDDGKFSHREDRVHKECQDRIDEENRVEEIVLGEVEDEHMWEHRYP